MARLRVAVLFGGASEEHEVSVKSAIEIAAHLDTERYEPIYMGISRSGVWSIVDRPDPDWERGPHPRAVISPDRSTHGLLVVDGPVVRADRVDVVFPVLHGKTGEDGAIQGLLELSGIPYVGCDIASSATCMDKSLAYVVARSAGIETPAFWIVDGPGRPNASEFRYPVFVKPARSGSSFGVSKVEGAEALEAAIAVARRYDDKILIEQAISGTEVGCAVLGNGCDLTVGEVDQITVRGGLFRIHQESEPQRNATYAEIAVPANVPEAKRDEIRATAKSIYAALGCRGLARVDMFLHEDGGVLLNEVNTLPGFTSYSRYPRMMAAAGLTLTEVIDRAIALAIAR